MCMRMEGSSDTFDKQHEFWTQERNKNISSAYWIKYRLKICRDGRYILPSHYLSGAKKLGRCFMIIGAKTEKVEKL